LTTPRSPNQFNKHTRLTSITQNQYNCSRISKNYNESTQILSQTGSRRVEKNSLIGAIGEAFARSSINSIAQYNSQE